MSAEQTDFQIRIKGHLDERWTLWLDGMTIRKAFNADGEPVTWITGPVVDQAALYGTLSRLRDLGVTLISVQQMGKDREGKQ